MIFPSARARVKMAAKTPLLGMVPALVNANAMDIIIQLLDRPVASVRTSKCFNIVTLKTYIIIKVLHQACKLIHAQQKLSTFLHLIQFQHCSILFINLSN